jgi:hypothetical protein
MGIRHVLVGIGLAVVWSGQSAVASDAAQAAAATEGKDVVVQVLLPDGKPAAEAMVVVATSLADTPEWASRCDEKGKVAVPRGNGTSWIGARHPGTGFALEAWQPAAGVEQASIQLGEISPPLVVRIEDANGKPAVGARVAVLVGNARVSGSLLAWLAACPAQSGGDGKWRGRGVPARDIGLLAWRSGKTLDTAIASGQHDGAAKKVSSPWPSEVRLKLIVE